MLIKKINTYVLNHINSTAKQYKASSSLRACFCCLWGSFSHFRKKNFNRVWKSRWSQFVEFLGLGALALLLNSREQIKIRWEILKREEKSPSFPFSWAGRGSVRAATAGTVATSHLLPKFGKLTTKFELLCQFWKAEIRHPFAAAYGKVVPSRRSHYRSVSWPQSLKYLAKRKNKAADGSLARYLCLIVWKLCSLVFSGS